MSCSTSSRISPAPRLVPYTRRAPAVQAAAQGGRPSLSGAHSRQKEVSGSMTPEVPRASAPAGQASRQAEHPGLHRSATLPISGRKACVSGLPHHRQRSGQPLRKTSVRIPGPSWTEKCWILVTTPVTSFSARAGLIVHRSMAYHASWEVRAMRSFWRSRLKSTK